MAIELQNQERPFNEASINNCVETETDFFQFGQMSTVEKVENVYEHVIADQKGDFHFLSLHTNAKIPLLF